MCIASKKCEGTLRSTLWTYKGRCFKGSNQYSCRAATNTHVVGSHHHAPCGYSSDAHRRLLPYNVCAIGSFVGTHHTDTHTFHPLMHRFNENSVEGHVNTRTNTWNKTRRYCGLSWINTHMGIGRTSTQGTEQTNKRDFQHTRRLGVSSYTGHLQVMLTLLTNDVAS